MRKQDSPGHRLPSFAGYLRKVFDFQRLTAGLRDARTAPDFSPQSVFLAVFHGFVFRLRSFQQLQADLSQPAFQHWIGAPRAVSDDVLRYSLCGFDLAGLEQMLVQVNRTLKRNKAFDEGRVQGRIVAALDGIEVLSSYSRHCDGCLQRRVTFTDRQGRSEERIQYYHRAVGCQIISSPVKPFLAWEWLQPGEGEDTATLRLLRRLPEQYGSRFFDILLLDSLYAQKPALQLAQQIGWDVVITFKQERRELYQSAMGLFQSRPADLTFEQRQAGRLYQVRLWQTEGIGFSQDYPQPMRVVRTEEAVTVNHRRGAQTVAETTQHAWMWITTLDARTFPGRQIWSLGHARWKNENNGWNDLTQNWALKHGFLHACRHRPKVRAESGLREAVPNRGLAAVALILCLAFVLASAFAILHSKLFRLYQTSLLEIGRQLYRSLWQLRPPIRAPAPESRS
jgi:hypothetical protein